MTTSNHGNIFACPADEAQIPMIPGTIERKCDLCDRVLLASPHSQSILNESETLGLNIGFLCMNHAQDLQAEEMKEGMGGRVETFFNPNSFMNAVLEGKMKADQD